MKVQPRPELFALRPPVHMDTHTHSLSRLPGQKKGKEHSWRWRLGLWELDQLKETKIPVQGHWHHVEAHPPCGWGCGGETAQAQPQALPQDRSEGAVLAAPAPLGLTGRTLWVRKRQNPPRVNLEAEECEITSCNPSPCSDQLHPATLSNLSQLQHTDEDAVFPNSIFLIIVCKTFPKTFFINYLSRKWRVGAKNCQILNMIDYGWF